MHTVLLLELIYATSWLLCCIGTLKHMLAGD